MILFRRLLAPAMALLLLPTASPARAQAPAPAASTITIEQPWARAAVQGGTGGVFLTIRNSGQQADRLVSMTSPLSRATELHTTVRDGDIMRMRPVRAIEVPPGGSVTLRPGGLHAMLVGLSQPVVAGGTVLVTLTFERAGAVPVQVPVLAAGATGPGAQH